MNKELFIQELYKLGIEITEEKYIELEKYYELLVEYNKITNLTTITNHDEVFLKHFYDSLTLIKAIDLNQNLSLCDIGTGAGFPGLVLKIIFPNLEITLVDSLGKRIEFLFKVIEDLKLSKIKVINKRIEDFAKESIEMYDIVTSRAVAKINVLLELGAQISKINGNFIMLKGNNYDIEIKEAKYALEILGYELDDIISFKLPIENSGRSIIKLKKIKKTPKEYPRDFSKIKKSPL